MRKFSASIVGGVTPWANFWGDNDGNSGGVARLTKTPKGNKQDL